jgi:hypothetical protein
MGLAEDSNLTLIETRVERLSSTVRITHVLQYNPLRIRLLTEPFTGYE